MIPSVPDLTATRFLLPADAKCLPVSDLSARLRARIGPVEDDQSVITRPGSRVMAKLVTAPLAALVDEFRAPSLITDAVLRFSRARDQDPFAILDEAFDAIARLVDGRILVPVDSIDARAVAPGLAAGQAFGEFEIEVVVRSLDDTEVYRARGPDGAPVALKIARVDSTAVAAMLREEARVLEHLNGMDSPKLLAKGAKRERAFIAMEWCEGVSIAINAQQARAARDLGRLHRLVTAMFEAYGRLHASGILHGDIHPGNCLMREDGAIVILDFGRARPIHAGATPDPARAGIPQFHDPAMAEALLAGRLPPACTPAAEQYALCVLAYLLLTGLHPIEAPAVREDLLSRIVTRPPLPFAARGVAAWPAAESVLRRGLAKQPVDRFVDVAALAGTFAAAAPKPAIPARRRPIALNDALEQTRRLTPSALPPLHRAWFALRAALTLEDAELLAAADILIGQAGPGWAARSVAIQIARAWSDKRMEREAVESFLTDAETLPIGEEAAEAVLAAAEALDGAAFRDASATPLALWASRYVHRRTMVPPSDREREEALLVEAALMLAKIGAAPCPPALNARLEMLAVAGERSVWLWALAHDVFARDTFRERALAAARPRHPLAHAFSLLRLHQMTGETRLVAAARRLLARETELAVDHFALLAIELRAPERAVFPSFLSTSPW